MVLFPEQFLPAFLPWTFWWLQCSSIRFFNGFVSCAVGSDFISTTGVLGVYPNLFCKSGGSFANEIVAIPVLCLTTTDEGVRVLKTTLEYVMPSTVSVVLVISAFAPTPVATNIKSKARSIFIVEFSPWNLILLEAKRADKIN